MNSLKPPQIGAENVGYRIIAAVPFANPGDWYLYHVLAHREMDGESVIWSYNLQTGGYAHGYYIREYGKALSEFANTVSEDIRLHGKA